MRVRIHPDDANVCRKFGAGPQLDALLRAFEKFHRPTADDIAASNGALQWQTADPLGEWEECEAALAPAALLVFLLRRKHDAHGLYRCVPVGLRALRALKLGDGYVLGLWTPDAVCATVAAFRDAILERADGQRPRVSVLPEDVPAAREPDGFVQRERVLA